MEIDKFEHLDLYKSFLHIGQKGQLAVFMYTAMTIEHENPVLFQEVKEMIEKIKNGEEV